MKTADTEYTEKDCGLSDDERKRLGCYLRLLREENKLSQESLSEIMDCTPQYVSDMERGKYTFSIKKLMLLCDHFNIPSDRLIFGNAERYSEYDKRNRILHLIEDMSLEQLDIIEAQIRLISKAFDCKIKE